MVFVPFPNGARVVVEYGNEDVQWTNTLWFEDVSAPPIDFQGLADYVHDLFNSGIMPHLSTNWYCRRVTAYDASTALGQMFESTVTPAQGQRTGEVAAVSPSLVVTFYSAVRGRSGRGRNYITGFAESDAGPISLLSSTALDDIVETYEALRDTSQQLTGFEWMIASQYGNGQPRSQVSPAAVTSVVVRTAIWGSQRRRIRRG